jgi:Zn-dependent protease
MQLDQVFSPQNIQTALIGLIALILSIAVHEFGHAVVADRLGDPLPRAQGRVTLNPIAHIDPWGTLLFPLISAFTGVPLLGWGRPVQISLSARHMTRRLSRKTSHMLIAAAGPTMNVLFAVVLSLLFLGLMRAGHLGLAERVLTVVVMNIGLAFFNLIPCPPLDGGAILAGILPDDSPVVAFLDRYGMFLFFALLLTGLLSIVMIPAAWVSSAWVRQLVLWIR